jgi:hypothetical protein
VFKDGESIGPEIGASYSGTITYEQLKDECAKLIPNSTSVQITVSALDNNQLPTIQRRKTKIEFDNYLFFNTGPQSLAKHTTVTATMKIYGLTMGLDLYDSQFTYYRCYHSGTTPQVYIIESTNACEVVNETELIKCDKRLETFHPSGVMPEKVVFTPSVFNSLFQDVPIITVNNMGDEGSSITFKTRKLTPLELAA